MNIVPADLAGPEEALVTALKGIDVVVASISPADQHRQIPLINAAKKAGVKRFVPCAYITIAPAGGEMIMRDWVRHTYVLFGEPYSDTRLSSSRF